MQARLWLVPIAAAIGACGGAEHTAPRAAAAPMAVRAPLPPACVKPPDDVAKVRAASATGTRVTYCIGAGAEQCFALDVASGELDHVAEPPSAAAPGARVAVTSPDLSVCTGDACVSIAPQVLPSTAQLRAAATADGAYAVVLLGDAERGRGTAEIWEVATKRRVAAFPYARGDFRCGEVALLGETIYLSAATCGHPAARASLYSLKGRRLGAVGGREFGSYGNAYVQVDGAVWAFLDENGTHLAIEDIAKGKVARTIDTRALWAPAAMGNPGESALVRMPDGKLAIIAGTPANGSIGVVDLATGALTVAHAPLCAAN